MNYYSILGVTDNADGEAVKKAYRKLVKECHPDTHPGDREAEERFKQVSLAYAVLSDEEKRRAYDEGRRNPAKTQPADFYPFVSPRKQEQKSEKRGNPIDTSALFERYMGFK